MGIGDDIISIGADPAQEQTPTIDPLRPGGKGVERNFSGVAGGIIHADDPEIVRLSVAVRDAQNADAVTAARAMRLAPKTGLPTDLIMRHVDEIDAETKRLDFDAYKFRTESPSVAQWIAERPEHAAVAREDLNKLGTFESLWKSVKFGRGVRKMQLGRLYFDRQSSESSGRSNPAVESQIQEIEKSLALEPEGGGFLLSTLQLSSEFLGMMGSILSASADEALAGMASGAAIGAAASAPTLGAAAPLTTATGAMTGLGVGFSTGMFRESSVISSGYLYKSVRDIRGKNGEQIDQQTAANIALAGGIVSGALEVFGAQLVIAPFKSAANKFISQAAVDALSYPTTKQAMVQFGKDWAKAVSGEVATETLQEVVSIAGEEMAKIVTSGEFETLANSPELRAEALARIVETAGQTLQGMAPLGLPGAGVNFSVNMRSAREAKERAEFFKKAGESIQSMQMAKSSPEATESAIDRLAQDGAPSTVFFSVDKWRQYWESRKVDPRAMAERLGADAKIYDQAVETGGDVQIPSAKYLALVGPTQHYNALIPEMRTSEDQMSQRESEEFLAKVEEQQKLAEETPEQQAARAVEQSTEQVRTQIEKQLTDIGYSPEVAGLDAQAMASFIRTQSALAGVKPTELLSRYGLRIEREGMQTAPPPEGTVVQSQPVDLSALSAEAKQFVESLSPGEQEALAPSIQYLTANPDPGGDLGNLKMVLDSEARKAAKQGLDLKSAVVPSSIPVVDQVQEESLGQDERGSFQITPDRKVIIRLAKSSDLSTFLHESGHFFIEVMSDLSNSPDAKPQQRQDWQTIINWWKSNSKQMRSDAIRLADRGGASNDILSAIRSMSDEDIADVANNFHHRQKGPRKWVRSAMHEYWARGTEAYFMEGKAPSAELRSVFDRFRLWLLDVYRAVKVGITDVSSALRVRLNDDIRQVMDRMLASQEAIDQAKSEGNVQPLFVTPEQAGMTPDEFAPYEKAVREASNKAQTELQLKLINQFNNESKAWWKEQKAKISAEVVDEVNKSKEQIALAVLLTGRMPDGSELPPEIKPVKIQRDTLTTEQYNALPKGVTDNNGVSAQTAAELFGYTTIEDMVSALSSAKPADELIESETNRRMKERHGDLMIDRAKMAEAARQEVMSDSREKVILAEMRALRRLQRAADPIARQRARESAENAKLVERARAQKQLEEERLKRIIDVGAERIKSEQRINEIEADAREKKAEQDKARSEMFDRLPNMADVNREAKRRVAAMQYKNLQPNNYWIAARRAAAEALRASSSGKYDVALNAKTRELMALAYYRASLESRDTADKHIKYLRGFNKDSARSALGRAGKEYLEQVDNLLDRFDLRRLTPKEREERKKVLSEFIKDQQSQGKTFGEEMAIPELFLDEAYRKAYTDLTVDEIASLYESIKNIASIASLQNRMFAAHKTAQRDVARAEMIESAQANIKGKGPQPFTKSGLTLGQRAGRKLQEFDASLIKVETLIDWLDGGDIAGPWRRYLFSGASKAQSDELDYTKKITAKIAKLVLNIPIGIRSKMLDRVSITGISRVMTRRDIIGVALNVGNESNYDKLLRGMKWSEQQVQEMLDQLTADEITFVNGIHDTLEGMWPDIAKLQSELTGLEPEKVESRPMKARNGVINGGYYPLMYDPIASETGEMQLSSSVGGLVEPSYTRATTPKGHTKSRIQNFTAPFDLDVDRLPLHIAGVVKDLTHRKWLIDANWIVNDKEIAETVRKALGDPYANLFKDWVKTIVNDRSHGSMRSLSIWHRMLEHLRFNVMIAGMGFKAATMLSQFSGIGPAIEVLSKYHGKAAKGALTSAYSDFLRSPRKTYDFVTENSGEMRNRISTRDRDMRDKLRLLQGNDSLLAEVQRVSLHGITYMDMSVSVPTWMAAYNLTFAETQNKSLAIEAGDRAVRMSQGSGGQKDLAAVSADRGWLRLITMFYTPFSALYSRLRDIGYSVKSPGDVPQAFIRSWWVWVFPAVVGELLAGRSPDDDEDWSEWMLKTIGIYPFMAIPGGRDVINGVVSDYGYSFSPIVSVFKSTTEAIDTTGGVITGDKELEELAADMFKASKYWLGLPVGQLEITGGYLLDLMNDEENPEDMGEFMHDVLYRRRE